MELIYKEFYYIQKIISFSFIALYFSEIPTYQFPPIICSTYILLLECVDQVYVRMNYPGVALGELLGYGLLVDLPGRKFLCKRLHTRQILVDG